MQAGAPHWGQADVSFSQAFQAQEAGKLNQAEALYAQALTIDPENVDSLHALGGLRRRAGDLDRAADALGAAHRLRPDNARIANDLGLVRQAQGRLSDALALFESALAIAPSGIAAALNKANVLARLHRTAHALECYHDLHEREPSRIEVITNLAGVLELDGQRKAAAEAIHKGLAIEPRNPALALTAARLERRAKRGATARKRLNQVLKTEHPAQVEAAIHAELGHVLASLDEHNEALASFKRANKISARLVRAQVGRERGKKMTAAVLRRVEVALTQANTLADAPADAGGSFSPTFIVGAPGAGISDLARSLRHLTDALVLDELSPMATIDRAWTQAEGAGRQVNLAAMREHYALLANQHVGRDTPRHVIDATGANLLCLDRVLALFPAARIVLVVRHPADQALAGLTALYAPSALTAQLLDPGDCLTLIDQINTVARSLGRALGDNLHVLRYETFLEEPRVALACVLKFLDVPARPRAKPKTPDVREGFPPGQWKHYWPVLREHRSTIEALCAASGYPFALPE